MMRAFVTLGIVTALALPAIGCAQEHNAAQDRGKAMDGAPDPGAGEEHKSAAKDHLPRRLETVTWNSVKHELTWVISKGEKAGSTYKALGTQNYEISMDDATMTFSGDTRRFSKEEAANVHVLMDVISKYAVDSTVWWDEGQGEPVNGNPKKENKDKESSPILHVAAQSAALVSLSDVQSSIQRLEQKLADLKRLERLLESSGPFRLTSY